jgi:glycosyltransferase involved in cell wall biosynthesis
MNLLMLVPYSGVRGPTGQIAQLLATALRHADCNVSVEHWGRHRDREGLVAKLVGRTTDALRIRRVVSAKRPQYVLVQTSHDPAAVLRDTALAIALRGRKARVVLHFHGSRTDELVVPGNLLLKLGTALLLRLTHGVLVLSSQELNALRSFYPQGNFCMVRNPFESTRGADAPIVARTTKTRKPASLLFVARLLPAKGIFETIEALALLHERRAARLLVAGSGPAEERVLARISELNLSECVTLAGHIEHDRLLAAYADADIFVLPTYHPEGFPTAISEAMDAGLPIVTTKNRGAKDHLEEGTNALFVPPHDPGSLARALEQLLSDHSLRQRMSVANQKKILEFAPLRVVGDYLGAFEEWDLPRGRPKIGGVGRRAGEQ